MTRTAPVLLAVCALLLGTSSSFGQGASAEARRHFEAGVAAVEAARSPADYEAALREFEQAVRLAPDWPGAVRGLGMVERAAKRYREAAGSFRRYLDLRPEATDAARIRSLAEEMGREAEVDAAASGILEGLASSRYERKTVGQSVLDGEPLNWPGGLKQFRLADGGLQVENPWYARGGYHPKQHPPIPRPWEPVKVSGRTYAYAYSHYMDTANGYVVRFDYRVKGEVVSAAPPRIRETVEWETLWGAPVEGNLTPWSGDLADWGVVQYLYELTPRGAAAAGGAEAGDGRTKLHLAAIAGRRDEAGSIIAAGADLNARDSAGATPLHLAAGFGKRLVADLLLSLGADRDARNDAGDTPLFTAAYWGHFDLVILLVEFGADVNARNKAGLTPLRAAETRNHADVAAFLKSRGAK